MFNRDRISLDGQWQFAADDAHIGLDKQWFREESAFTSSIQVPGCWQAQGMYCHTGWYRTGVVVPADWLGKQVWLKFGGVSYETDVWINEKQVIRHEGLMLPFDQEIGRYVHYGDINQIVVRVAQYDYANVFQTEQLGDKIVGVYGCWTTWGGIYQPVSLEAAAPIGIDTVFLIPDIDKELVVARVRLKNASADKRRIDVSVDVDRGAEVFQGSEHVMLAAGGEIVVDVPVSLQHVTLWHPDNPFLYVAHITLSAEGRAIDGISERFGMREVAVRGKHILLNHEPIFLLGWLDDAVFPDQISPTITEQDARQLLEMCKVYGFNFVRHHTHIPVPVFHQIADEIGVLQLQEFASFGSIGNPRVDPTQKTRQQIYQTWHGMIERDRNHPSIIGYGVNNECWNEHEFRSWASTYRDLYRLGKELDPTRLIIDNSGGEDHWSVASDVYDKHLYQFPTDHEMERSSQGRRYRGYIPKRDAYFNVDLATVGKPCLVTEVGGWCTFPDFGKIREQCKGQTPWWLSRDTTRNPRMAHALVNRMEDAMADAGLIDLYPTIIANSERYAGMANKLQIEHMRQTPGIAGYVYCTFTDCYNWGSGIVDNYLQPKSNAQAFARLNQPSILLWPRTRWCFRAGEEIEITLALSHYGNEPIVRGCLHWRLTDGTSVLADGTQEGLAIPSYQVHDFDVFRLKLPESPNPARLTMHVELTGEPNGNLGNEWSLWVFPPAQLDPGSQAVNFYGSADELERWQTVFPFIRAAEAPGGDILITTRLTESVVSFLEAGGKVLWLQQGTEQSCRPYNQDPAVDYRATLISDHPITATVPHEGWCDLQFHHLIGTAVLDTGYFELQKLRPIIEAFHVPYWMQNPRILPFRRKGFLAEAQIGRGRLLTTTFVFKGLGAYPEVDAMAQTLIAYLLSPLKRATCELTADDVREWAWGSVNGEVKTDFVPYLM
jgi:Glycosyl hydrolases family 2, sugar binding domain/Glycosyl hydrolases family 2/Glycosyl hydrolases family 2, TIM barrel domain